MSEYSSLKATINANVKTNGNQEITGSIMNSVLNAMVDSLGAGYQFIGMATPTNPESAQTPDYKCFYLATTPGTYTNLGGLVVADGEVAFLKYDTAWTKEVTGAATANQLNQLGQNIPNRDFSISWIANQYVNIDGSIVNLNGYHRTDYLGVWGLKTLKITSTNGSSFNVFFDENKEFVSYFAIASGENTITIPSNAMYVMLSGVNAYVPEINYEIKGIPNVVTTFNSESQDDALSARGGKILNEKINDVPETQIAISWIANQYVNVDGSIIDLNGWHRTDYLLMWGVDKLIVSSTIASSYNVFFDENKEFVSYFAIASGENTITIPSNAMYVMLSGLNAYVPKITKNNPRYVPVAIDSLNSENKINALSSRQGKTLDRKINQFPLRNYSQDWIANQYVNVDGSIVDLNGWHRTDYLGVWGLKMLKITSTNGSSYNVFFDENKEFVSYFSISSGDNNIEIPSEAMYVMLSGVNAYVPEIVTEMREIPEIEEKGIFRNNIEREGALLELSKHIDSANETTSHLLTFAFGSDFHGTLLSLKNMFSYAQQKDTVDFVINGGDTQPYSPDDVDILPMAMKGTTKPIFNVIGNHDNGYGADATKMLSAQAKYERYVQPYLSQMDVVQPSDLSDYPCYYYKDFTDTKIRLIVVDLYDCPKVTYNNGQICNQDYNCVSVKQANFIGNALLNLPNDYSVMVVAHTVDSTCQSIVNKFTAFPDKSQYRDGGNMDESPVHELVSAFINKTSLNKRYNYIGDAYDALNANGLSTYYDISFDFSNRETSNFICYLHGHYHRDSISKNSENLLYVGVVNGGTSARDQSSSDIARYDINSTYNYLNNSWKEDYNPTIDCFNIMSIDTYNHKIRILRIGVNATINMELRDMVSIAY